MKKQPRNSHKLALHKETVRSLDQLELTRAGGGSIHFTVQVSCGGCPSVHQVCLTTHTTTNP